jgi:hypothetical protein
VLNQVVHIATSAGLNYITDKSKVEKLLCKYNLDISIGHKCVGYGNCKSIESVPCMALQPLLGHGLS